MFWPVVRMIMFIVLSGTVAYVGDYVGHRTGKLKFTIFGFRPRKTSRVIAVLTGILISLITLSLLLVFTREARIALFGLEKIQQEIYGLEDRKDVLEKEVYELEEDKKELADTINAMQSRVSVYPLVFEAYEPITYGVIKKGSSKEEIKKTMEVMREKVKEEFYKRNTDLSQIVAARGMEAPKNLKGKILFLNYEDFIYYLNTVKSNQVVCIRAVFNLFLGDDLCVKFTCQDDQLIFRKGETIVEKKVNPSLSRKEICDSFAVLLDDIKFTALNKGMTPAPGTGLGVELSIPYIWDQCDRIMAYSSEIKISIVATEDIWTPGPLKFDIKLEPVR